MVKESFILVLYACAKVNQGRYRILHRLIPFAHGKRRALEGGQQELLCPPPQAQTRPKTKRFHTHFLAKPLGPAASAIAVDAPPQAERTWTP